MARFSVVIPTLTEKKNNSMFIVVSLVAGKENYHQKLKYDIKRETALKYFVFVYVFVLTK